MQFFLSRKKLKTFFTVQHPFTWPKKFMIRSSVLKKITTGREIKKAMTIINIMTTLNSWVYISPTQHLNVRILPLEVCAPPLPSPPPPPQTNPPSLSDVLFPLQAISSLLWPIRTSRHHHISRTAQPALRIYVLVCCRLLWLAKRLKPSQTVNQPASHSTS